MLVYARTKEVPADLRLKFVALGWGLTSAKYTAAGVSSSDVAPGNVRWRDDETRMKALGLTGDPLTYITVERRQAVALVVLFNAMKDETLPSRGYNITVAQCRLCSAYHAEFQRAVANAMVKWKTPKR